jgi:hypothetical protein
VQYAESLTYLNAVHLCLSKLRIVIAEQPKDGCSDGDGNPGPARGRGFFVSCVATDVAKQLCAIATIVQPQD